MGSVAIVKAYFKIGSINARAGITIKKGIGALSSIYSRGIYK